ncbi:MAG: hypothetical protein IKG97_00815 [Lachnospiraceae bacterium]|nr:hypothetical protein [Lachnospiraceae bacterium]
MTDKQKDKIYRSMTDIDDRYIEDAAEERQKTTARPVWRIAVGIAAALAVAAAGILFFTRIAPEKANEGDKAWPTRIVGNDENPDAKAPAPGPGDEIAYEKHWDEKSLDEKYNHLDYDGRTYFNHAAVIPESRRGKCLAADIAAYGYDPYSEGKDSIRYMPTLVYEITGVSPKIAVGVELEGERHLAPFVVDVPFSMEARPETLGGLLRDWNLEEDLRIGTVYYYQDKKAWEQGYGTVCFDGADRAEVLRTLLAKTDTKRIEDLPAGTERILYSLAIYDDALGISNLALSVYEGGYLWTNLTGYASIFKIEEADAEAFLNYVLGNLEGYIPVYEKNPGMPDEGVPEAAPVGTVVESSEARTE